jgi:hypothetical protein
MTSKLKLRAGDIVHHRSLDLGPGTVRYAYRGLVLVNFENSPVQRYSKNQICKSPAHSVSTTCAACGHQNTSLDQQKLKM